MENKEIVLELMDGKDRKKLLIEGVDVSKYLISYSLTSTQNSKDIILRFRLPNKKINVRVD